MSPPSYIRPVPVNESSPFLGDQCALCKAPFEVDDKLVICPEDGSRHHRECWEANGNRCTAYGCAGQGEVVEARLRSGARPYIQNAPDPAQMGRFATHLLSREVLHRYAPRNKEPAPNFRVGPIDF